MLPFCHVHCCVMEKDCSCPRIRMSGRGETVRPRGSQETRQLFFTFVFQPDLQSGSSSLLWLFRRFLETLLMLWCRFGPKSCCCWDHKHYVLWSQGRSRGEGSSFRSQLPRGVSGRRRTWQTLEVRLELTRNLGLPTKELNNCSEFAVKDLQMVSSTPEFRLTGCTQHEQQTQKFAN